VKDSLTEDGWVGLLKYLKWFVDKHQVYYLLLMIEIENNTDDAVDVLISHDDMLLYNEYDI